MELWRKAMNDWKILRFQDFKSVEEYDSALMKIAHSLELCDEVQIMIYCIKHIPHSIQRIGCYHIQLRFSQPIMTYCHTYWQLSKESRKLKIPLTDLRNFRKDALSNKTVR